MSKAAERAKKLAEEEMLHLIEGITDDLKGIYRYACPGGDEYDEGLQDLCTARFNIRGVRAKLDSLESAITAYGKGDSMRSLAYSTLLERPKREEDGG